MGSKNSGRRAIVLVHGLLVLAVALAFVGCDSNGANTQAPIAVEGTWLLDSDYDGDGTVDGSERWTISGDTITYESDFGAGFARVYSATVVSYSNNGLNGGDVKISSSAAGEAADPGFAVIEYTEVDGPGTGEVGKFNVFRWADNADDPEKKNFTQGYKDATPDDSTNFDNALFDTAAAAESGATNENGYFAFASAGAVKQ